MSNFGMVVIVSWMGVKCAARSLTPLETTIQFTTLQIVVINAIQDCTLLYSIVIAQPTLERSTPPRPDVMVSFSVIQVAIYY